jgi:hypothetical protein
VQVIRHDATGIDINAGVIQRNFIPNPLHHTARIVQLHGSIHNFAKQARAILADDGHVIGPGLRVIVTSQADRPAMVAFGIIDHNLIYL